MIILITGGNDYNLTLDDVLKLNKIYMYLNKQAIENGDILYIVNSNEEGAEADALDWARSLNLNTSLVYKDFETINSCTCVILFNGADKDNVIKNSEPVFSKRITFYDYRNIAEKIENNKPTKNSLYFLQKSIDVQKERGEEYEGDGQERSFQKMATVFNTKTGKDLTAAHMALIMQDLKDIRFFSSDRYHEDSLLDGVSYASLKAELAAQQYNA